ncbi:hypothetical protein TNCV_3959761 [Trichonephila clavipes]|nr:hypothetical protein TNCV_3959761 [Trichonephila clavipes]
MGFKAFESNPTIMIEIRSFRSARSPGGGDTDTLSVTFLHRNKSECVYVDFLGGYYIRNMLWSPIRPIHRASGACRSSAPRARNELKSALNVVVHHPYNWRKGLSRLPYNCDISQRV